ncbi:hypothetical protein HK405_008129, partial [Cladochytrium tenue]
MEPPPRPTTADDLGNAAKEKEDGADAAGLNGGAGAEPEITDEPLWWEHGLFCLFAKYQKFFEGNTAKPAGPTDWNNLKGPTDVAEKDDFEKFMRSVVSDMTISLSPLGLIIHGYILYVTYAWAAYCPTVADITTSSGGGSVLGSLLGYLSYPFRVLVSLSVPAQTNPLALVSCPTRPWTFHKLTSLIQLVFYTGTLMGKLRPDLFLPLDRFCSVYLLDITNSAVWLPWFVVRGAQFHARTVVSGLHPRAWRSLRFWGSWLMGGPYSGPVVCWWIFNICHRAAIGLFQWEAAQEVALEDEVARRVARKRELVQQLAESHPQTGGRLGEEDMDAATLEADVEADAARMDDTDGGGLDGGGWRGWRFRTALRFSPSVLLAVWHFLIHPRAWGPARLALEFAEAAAGNESVPLVVNASTATVPSLLAGGLILPTSPPGVGLSWLGTLANASSLSPLSATPPSYATPDAPRLAALPWLVTGVFLPGFLMSGWVALLAVQHRLV